ncbi:hypothetical protein L4D18_21900 [Vibrio campbellii]|uniref:hypothetical protein n=1 Tax=Vibrio campbellii TaxID=680 RepID=UPI003D0F227E
MLFQNSMDILAILLIWFAFVYALFQAFKAQPLDKHCTKRHWFTSIGMGITTIIFFCVQSFPFIHGLTWGVLLTFVLAQLVFRVQTSSAAKLAVVPNILKTTHAQVHLSNVKQALDKHTYKELPLLLNELSELGFEVVTLTSPMFSKKNKIRNLAVLKKVLSNEVEDIQVKPLHWSRALWKIGLLSFEKYVQRAPSLHNTPVMNWCRITLILTRRTSEKL